MDSKSQFLKIYEKRAGLLFLGPMSLKSFSNFLKSNEILIPKLIKKILISASQFSDSLRPELIIETALQIIRKSRDFEFEKDLLQRSVFSKVENIIWEKFKKGVTQNYLEKYGKNETFRILQLFKRYGLSKDGFVSKDYFWKFIATSQGDMVSSPDESILFFISQANKLNSDNLKKKVLRILKIKKSSPVRYQNNKENINTAHKLDHLKIEQKLTNLQKGISSTKNSSICSEVTLSSQRSSKDPSVNLRNKLFTQALAKLATKLQIDIKSEAFQVIKNPYKHKNAFVHRSVALLYLKLRQSASVILKHSFDRWNNHKKLDCSSIEDKNSVSNITFTNENWTEQSLNPYFDIRARNYKSFLFALSISFKFPVIRIQKCLFSNLRMILKRNRKLRKVLRNYSIKTKEKCLLKWNLTSGALKHIGTLKIRSANKIRQLNFSINAMSKQSSLGRLASINQRLLQKQIFVTWILWRSKVFAEKAKQKPKKSLKKKSPSPTRSLKNSKSIRPTIKSPSRCQTQKSPVRSLTPKSPSRSPVSKSFSVITKSPKVVIKSPNKKLVKSLSEVASPINSSTNKINPMLSLKYDDLKSSVRRIRIHHGIEKLWFARRMMNKTKTVIPKKAAFLEWKHQTQKSKINVSLPCVYVEDHRAKNILHKSLFSFSERKK